jgi:hypothetical protein
VPRFKKFPHVGVPHSAHGLHSGSYVAGASADYNAASNTLASHKLAFGLTQKDLTVTATL